jgi:hypothetical protein
MFATAEPGFTDLFNGKDFTGWTIAGAPDTCPFRNHWFRNFELNKHSIEEG